MNEPKTQDTSNYEQLRAALLLEAASKPVRRVWQYEGFTNIEQGELCTPIDNDGDFLEGGECAVLGALDCVRVQIPADMQPNAAARLLRKLLALVELDGRWAGSAAPAVVPDLATATLKAALALTQRRQLPGEDVVF